MCGICGVLADERGPTVAPEVARLSDALAHRGPDGSDRRELGDPSAVFAHRRLSIVDLDHGAQPMGNEDARVWVTLNGELYNHLELRAELERSGHRFRTRADTEVLVHGWEEWGLGILGRLNGIFAFALWDGRDGGRGRVVLARDPAGVKPLYVGRSDRRWWFSSELEAARRAGLVGGPPTKEALGLFLAYRFIPAPTTPYADAWKLPPGHYLELPLDALPAAPRFEAFEHGFGPASLPRSESEWEDALRAGLRSAVRRQLMSDVPVGSLLSGGVDSTLVTRYMTDALDKPPLCFGIGFADAPDASELEHVRRAAEALRVPLETTATPEADYLAEWPAQIGALGEPIANSGTLLVALLCRLVRRSRKVVLSGQGADEPLGGYPRHAFERWAPLARRFRWALGAVPARALAGDRVARLRRMAAGGDAPARAAETLAVFGVAEAAALARLSTPEVLTAPVRYWFDRVATDDSLNRLLIVDARLSLADDLLLVADHTSMAASVELRVPFLDLEFLSLIERMPGRLKVSAGGERKWLYRRAVARDLPPTLRRGLTGWKARTGRKLGFATPLDRWFARWAERDADEYLLGPRAVLPSLLDTGRVRGLLDADAARRGRSGRQLLSLYVLETWLRARVERAAA